MKKLNLFLAVLVCSLVFSVGAKAQDPADFFAGKWDVLTLGTPQGDSHSLLVLERKDGKLVGTFKPAKGGEAKLTKVQEKDNKSITAYFTTSGYDVYLFLEKKDDGTLTGSMMDMFDSTATRIVEVEKK